MYVYIFAAGLKNILVTLCKYSVAYLDFPSYLSENEYAIVKVALSDTNNKFMLPSLSYRYKIFKSYYLSAVKTFYAFELKFTRQ